MRPKLGPYIQVRSDRNRIQIQACLVHYRTFPTSTRKGGRSIRSPGTTFLSDKYLTAFRGSALVPTIVEHRCTGRCTNLAGKQRDNLLHCQLNERGLVVVFTCAVLVSPGLISPFVVGAVSKNPSRLENARCPCGRRLTPSALHPSTRRRLIQQTIRDNLHDPKAQITIRAYKSHNASQCAGKERYLISSVKVSQDC